MKLVNAARPAAALLSVATAVTVVFASLTGCSALGTVRQKADRAGLTFGTAIQAGDILDPDTKKFIAKNFNLIVPENTMKWANLRPTKKFWNWSDMDHMVEFAEQNRIAMKGHTFVWHQQNPPYVSGLQTREEALPLLIEQITEVMKRYRGRIREYDVANEVLNEDGTLRNTVWLRTIGPEYIDIAFKAAREADPDAKLLLNDYSNEYAGTAKGDAFYELVRGMAERGVPIDGVGLQLHMIAENPLRRDALDENIARFNALGLYVSFTEVDVRVLMPVTPEKEAEQTAFYEGLLEAATAQEGAGSFILWGWRDAKSWIPAAFAGYGSAHPFDVQGKRKPLYDAMVKVISNAKR